MSWRDNLVPASFRGAAFKVESVTTEVGRRNAVHEYPFKDRPYVEDLGRSAEMFTVVGYVVQNTENDFNYIDERDNLIIALEGPGSGTLVHPFFGELTVALIGKARIEERLTDGSGIARIQMVFSEDHGAEYPSQEVDYPTAVDDVVDSEFAAAITRITEGYAAVSGTIAQASADVQSGINMIRGTMSSIQAGTTSVISNIQTTISSVYDTVDSIINYPSQLADAFVNTLDSYRGLSGSVDGGSLVDAALQLTKFGELPSSTDASRFGGALPPIVDSGTELSDQRIANRDLFIQTARLAGVMSASSIAMSIEYDSYQDAVAMMTKLVAAIDDLLSYIDSDNDELYSTVQSFKPLVVAGLQSKGASLPLIVDYEVPAEVTPTLVISQRLYNDLDREQEIIDRNIPALIHPGFPPGGDTIEVRNE